MVDPGTSQDRPVTPTVRRLFVGGIWHGRFVDLPDGDQPHLTWIVPIAPPMPPTVTDGGETRTSSEPSRHYYQLKQFASGRFGVPDRETYGTPLWLSLPMVWSPLVIRGTGDELVIHSYLDALLRATAYGSEVKNDGPGARF